MKITIRGNRVLVDPLPVSKFPGPYRVVESDIVDVEGKQMLREGVSTGYFFGTIVGKGDGVRELNVGDRVYWHAPNGSGFMFITPSRDLEDNGRFILGEGEILGLWEPEDGDMEPELEIVDGHVES